MSGRSDLPRSDGGDRKVTDDFAEALHRGRATAKRTFWGMMIAAALIVLVGGLLDRWLLVGVLLVGFSYPLFKVLREYRDPREFAKLRYWDTVRRVLDRHDDAAELPSAGEESAAQRRIRIQDEMDQIRHLSPRPKSPGGGSLWPPVLLTLAAAAAGTLYLAVGHNTKAGVTWFCVAGLVAGLGWLSRVMRRKERKALALLEEELQEVTGGARISGSGFEEEMEDRSRGTKAEDGAPASLDEGN